MIRYYKAKVERSIGEKTRKGYHTAVSYAEKVRAICDRLGRLEEFQRYIAQIRLANANRRALLEEFSQL